MSAAFCSNAGVIGVIDSLKRNQKQQALRAKYLHKKQITWRKHVKSKRKQLIHQLCSGLLADIPNYSLFNIQEPAAQNNYDISNGLIPYYVVEPWDLYRISNVEIMQIYSKQSVRTMK